MELLKPSEALSIQGNLRENWRRRVQQFDLYLTALGKKKEKEDAQCAILLHVVGEETLEIYTYNTFQFVSQEDSHKLDVLKSKFEEYVNPRKTPCLRNTNFGSTRNKKAKRLTSLSLN